MTQVSVKKEPARKRQPSLPESTVERPGLRFMPRTDIYEDEGAVLLRLDMPGVEEKDLDIELENAVLSVHGKVRPVDTGGRRLALQEYEVGDYARSFTLGSELDPAGIEARLQHGVLEIRLPKRESARPRRIPIQSK